MCSGSGCCYLACSSRFDWRCHLKMCPARWPYCPPGTLWRRKLNFFSLDTNLPRYKRLLTVERVVGDRNPVLSLAEGQRSCSEALEARGNRSGVTVGKSYVSGSKISTSPRFSITSTWTVFGVRRKARSTVAAPTLRFLISRKDNAGGKNGLSNSI